MREKMNKVNGQKKDLRWAKMSGGHQGRGKMPDME